MRGIVTFAFGVDYDHSNNQGALCLEDGQIFSGEFVFHGPYNGAKIKTLGSPPF